MTVQTIDDLWFSAHPDQKFRLRRLTQSEISRWPILPDSDCTWWVLIRRADGQVQPFGAGPYWSISWTDDELSAFFEELTAPIVGVIADPTDAGPRDTELDAAFEALARGDVSSPSPASGGAL